MKKNKLEKEKDVFIDPLTHIVTRKKYVEFDPIEQVYKRTELGEKRLKELKNNSFNHIHNNGVSETFRNALIVVLLIITVILFTLVLLKKYC